MAEVVLFHHVLGHTGGMRAFADELRSGGHTVHTPDLFDGERPASIDEGMVLVRAIGDELLSERVDLAMAGLPETVVYAGSSPGAGVAQRLAQTRSGARGALPLEDSRSSANPNCAASSSDIPTPSAQAASAAARPTSARAFASAFSMRPASEPIGSEPAFR